MDFAKYKLTHGYILIFASTIVLMTVLSPVSMLTYLFIIFGQAHFIISYIYSFRAGKVDRKYLIKFLSLFLLISVLCLYIYNNYIYYDALLLGTMLLFVIHYFNDELRIMGFQNIKGKLFGAAASVCSFCYIFLVKLFDYNGMIGTLFFGILGGIFLCIFLRKIFLLQGVNENKYLVAIFSIVNFIVPPLFVFSENVSLYQIGSAIILFHYLRWYIHYGLHFQGSELSLYLKFVFFVNVIVFLFFGFYYYSPIGNGLDFLFHPIFFYGWTILHILLSIRKGDFLR